MRVYVAGPISKNCMMANIRNAVAAGAKLMDAGHQPLVPHLSCFSNMMQPFDYERWMEWDFAWIEVCQALVRIPGESAGADREVKFAFERNIPVYLGVDEFLRSVQVSKEVVKA